MKTDKLLDLILNETTLELMVVENSNIKRKRYYLLADENNIEQLKTKQDKYSSSKQVIH